MTSIEIDIFHNNDRNQKMLHVSTPQNRCRVPVVGCLILKHVNSILFKNNVLRWVSDK